MQEGIEISFDFSDIEFAGHLYLSEGSTARHFIQKLRLNQKDLAISEVFVCGRSSSGF